MFIQSILVSCLRKKIQTVVACMHCTLINFVAKQYVLPSALISQSDLQFQNSLNIELHAKKILYHGQLFLQPTDAVFVSQLSFEVKSSKSFNTGKSFSEALIFASTNPQNDDRLFNELQVQYMKIPSSNLGRTCCVQKLFLIFRTIFVHNMFSPCSAKKELLTKIYLYCQLLKMIPRIPVASL